MNNEIAESTGPSWVTPVYNRAGNMTTIPKPADPTASFTATYDAWNRLVKIVEGANTVAEYEYDAAKRRTVKKTYTGGTLDETRHLYYTDPSRWQVIEERIDSSSDPSQQFIWGLRYVDDLVLRDRDTTDPANGTLDERLYALQDANWNMTALSNTSGAIQERYAYAAYGSPVFLTSTFGLRTSSIYDWETLFAGYRYDKQVAQYHVKNRVLHVNLGLWLQRDPIGYADGVNLNEYVQSTPTTLVDAFGLLTNPDTSKCVADYSKCWFAATVAAAKCLTGCLFGWDVAGFLACMVVGAAYCIWTGPVTPECITIAAGICLLIGLVIYIATAVPCINNLMKAMAQCKIKLEECDPPVLS